MKSNARNSNDVQEYGDRKNTGLTQAEFAARFGFSPRTLQQWEIGRRMPVGPARVPLTIITRESKAVRRALAAE